MKKIMAVTVTLCMLFLVFSILPIHGESELYSGVLRLHVLAHSDSEEDQALKLKVRDGILAASGKYLWDCDSREEAESAILQHSAELTDAAEVIIAAEGFSYPVRIELGQEIYPTRNYESFCFPSGEYLSLRVIIGDGAGKNWWCVLFPPMCLSAASTSAAAEEDCIAVGLTTDQYSMITETQDPVYTARFRILEVLEEALR
ncbi:MAG: stage II sporulation protein R [Clostridia bacterium]|nr:stage II sporulation protein R [Clostridia bacterium]